MDYEKLGAFYLGKEFDLGAVQLKDNLVLYDSKDLTTHAVIIGMTGSGKTGLGIGILEEALVDNIPLIAIDPKGDLANLLLTFPDLTATNFRPWINLQEATTKGMTPEEYAEGQAKLWQEGLAQWGQSAERIAKLRRSVDMAVYTPGSSAGLPVSVLRSFNAPSESVKSDIDLYRERIQTTATGILALLGMEADPVTSREHILLANILEKSWVEGKNLDLASLIRSIQEPPFERIGVMDLDMFYPAKDRFALAMKLNNLLAAPGFEAWLEGEPLDIQRMLYTSEGRPRASIFSIAHLSDSERMFFVTMLLSEVLAWVRSQSGTSSLRALLYMDEIFGYLPPTANPPSKTPMLTLLKQARAFGLGLVLSTQNPVDLDYKALSNAGTWFIGRLQTERDKERVLEGLQGASQEGFDRAQMERILSGLGKRVFLLHSVHENAPTIFQTRWAMSYLAGPMTREQIKQLMQGRKTEAVATAPVQTQPVTATSAGPPVMPQGVNVFYAPASGSGAGLFYAPSSFGIIAAHYSSAKNNLSEEIKYALAAELLDGPVSCNWEEAHELKLDSSDLLSKPMTDASFAELPREANSSKAFDKWQKDLLTYVRQKRPLTLFESKEYKQLSKPDESEGDFRARLAQLAREKRDLEAEKIKGKYAEKFQGLQNKLSKAELTIEKEAAQARQKQMDTVVSVGTALLGAVLGRKMSVSTASRTGTAIRSAGKMQKEQQDIARAKESAESIQQEIAQMQADMEAEVEKLSGSIDPSQLALEPLQINAKSTDLTVRVYGLLWLPYRKDAQGRLSPDW